MVRLGVEFRKEFVKVAFCELPFEGGGNRFVVLLEAEDMLFKGSERRKVIRSESLSLHDREVDFDLVEPTGVYRTVNQDEIGVLLLET